MAKHPQKSGGNSRIRFILLDADLPDGDVSQITLAIQNAFRGSQAGALTKIAQPNRVDPQTEISEIDQGVEDTIPEEKTPSFSIKPKPQRRTPPATPSVLDLDLSTSVALADYASKANPKSDRKKFLLVAAWFKEHRGLNAITADHIYTAYRHLKWPTNIADFSQPLRNLKADQLFTSPEKGSYAINHLGIAEVEKLSKGSE